METGKFYFIKNEYYKKFENCGLMSNKDIDDQSHGRPCFYCFQAENYYWMVPISSQIQKYENLYDEKIKRYGSNFDGIRFGYVNGEKRAFLIQNLCPITEKYAGEKYRINHNTVDVTIDSELSAELNKTVRKALRLYKKGIKIVLTDLDKILKDLS